VRIFIFVGIYNFGKVLFVMVDADRSFGEFMGSRPAPGTVEEMLDPAWARENGFGPADGLPPEVDEGFDRQHGADLTIIGAPVEDDAFESLEPSRSPGSVMPVIERAALGGLGFVVDNR
jgi:hypothetical protein